MKNTLLARIGSGFVGLTLFATALPALADTSTSTPGTYNVACAQSAVSVREDAAASALATYNAALASAASVRKAEVVTAWAQTGFTARFEALKASMVKYRTSAKAAGTTYKNSRTSTQTVFETSMKACGVTQADLSGTTTTKVHAKKERGNNDSNEKRGHGKMGLGFGLDGGLGLHFGHNK